MSQAKETQGSGLWIGDASSPPDFTHVKEMVSFNGFDGQANEIDVTSLDSTAKEFLMGLQDFGNFSSEHNWLPSDPGQQAMRAAKATRAITPFEFRYSDGSKHAFNGYVMSAPVSGGVDAKIDGSFTIRVTGEPVFTPAP